MTASARYLDAVRAILDDIAATQGEALEDAARICAQTIASGRMVHAFGSGHSRAIVEEFWPRYGSYPGFHPMVELSVGSWASVTGVNGQRQAMFLENVAGLAAAIVRNFALDKADACVAVSSGGTSVVTVEVAEAMRAAAVPVIAVTSMRHSSKAAAKAPSGKRLFEVADVVLDTRTPVGDAAVSVDGLPVPVAPTTTVAAAALANALKARTAELLVAAGAPPLVLASGLLAGDDEARAGFDAAYDEHARRLARILTRP